MRAALRIPLAILAFYGAVMAFTFAGTFLHEAAHAAAWEPTETPDVRFENDRDSAQDALGQQKRLAIDGVTYNVVYVDETTIALYPKAILLTGATLGIAPSAVMPETVLGTTFYAFEDSDYERLARGGDATGWHHSALPMLFNLLFAVPIWIWLLKRPGPLSMAAAWTNGAEWRFNVHHAEEVGIPAGLYLTLSIIIMMATAGAISYLAARKARRVFDEHHAKRSRDAPTPPLPS